MPILEILFLLLTVDLKAIQIQGDSLDRRGFGFCRPEPLTFSDLDLLPVTTPDNYDL